MASLQKVRVQRRTYWRIVESRRINGKPRAIPILHLGTADALLNRLLAVPKESITVQSFQHGDVAALKAVADRLDVVATIDQHVESHGRSPSVGITLLLAAINRAVQPCSKRGWARPRRILQPEQPAPQAWQLFCQLVSAQPPFVYT